VIVQPGSKISYLVTADARGSWAYHCHLLYHMLAMVKVDQFELRVSDGDTPMNWDAEGWLGYDLNKLWIKTEGTMLTVKLKRLNCRPCAASPLPPTEM
jgi:uncharacterized protein involved in copper resistance